MVRGDRIEGLRYCLEIWTRETQYKAGEQKSLIRLGNFSFDTFEDLWCFVDTYREHYEEPNSLEFNVDCR